MKKIILSTVIIFTLLLIGCSNDELSEENEEVLAKLDLKKDLKWMDENNEDVISSDAILQKREEGNLGPTVQFSKRSEDDTDYEGREELFVSFNGNKMKLEIGYDAPNVDTVLVSTMNDKERDDVKITLPELDLFDPFFEEDDIFNLFAEDTKWELTVADVTGDGVFEVILIAQDYREITAVRTIVAVYEYIEDEEEPLQLMTQFTGFNLAKWEDQSIYYTDAHEFIQEEDKVKKARAYFEEGVWYTEDNGLVENRSESSLFYFNEDFDLVEGENPNKEDDPRLTFAPVDEEIEEDDIPQTNEAIDDLATEEDQAGLDAIEYARLSTEARTEGDYDRVFELVKDGSEIDEELKALIKDNQERGVELTYEGGTVVDTDVLTSGESYDVTIEQEFYITGVEKEGLRQFETIYRMEYDKESGNFQAVKLIDEKEI